ncbi:MAG: hypothetical protein ABI690_29675 [Chloroflexota bacterium]
MIRSYLKLIPTFAIVFLALSLAARALGATQPPNPALRGFTKGCEDKPQPCWYGIVPGITTWDDNLSVIKAHGFQSWRSWWDTRTRSTNYAEIDASFLIELSSSATSKEIETITLSPNCRFVGWMGYFEGTRFQLSGEQGIKRQIVRLNFTNIQETDNSCVNSWRDILYKMGKSS